MAEYINDNAIVLKTYKLKESDRIAVLLTYENALVKVVAKGARKGNSFASRIQPGSVIKAQWYKKYELGTLTQALSIFLPQKIGMDYEALRCVAVVCESAMVVCQDGILEDENAQLFDMTHGVLKALEKYDKNLCVSGFLWKVLLFLGMADSVEKCSICSKNLEDESGFGFNVESNQFVCNKCSEGQILKLENEFLDFFYYIETNQTAKALQMDIKNKQHLFELMVLLFQNITDYTLRSA